jgi:competence transcription factor ComK
MAAKMIVNELKVGYWTISSDTNKVSISDSNKTYQIIETQTQVLVLPTSSDYTCSSNVSVYTETSNQMNISLDFQVTFTNKATIEISLPTNSNTVDVGKVIIMYLDDQSKQSSMGTMVINDTKDKAIVSSDLFDPLYSPNGLRVIGTLKYYIN